VYSFTRLLTSSTLGSGTAILIGRPGDLRVSRPGEIRVAADRPIG
jgi:hypothetical protein